MHRRRPNLARNRSDETSVIGRDRVKSGHNSDIAEVKRLTDAVEKGLRTSPNSDSADSEDDLGGGGDDGAADWRLGEFILEQEPCNRVSPHCECWPRQTATLWLSCGQNFSPACLPGSLYFYKSQSRHAARAHQAIFRAAAFMSRLTSTQVPRGVPQFLHDKTVSLVGASGRSSRPPHFPHLKLLSEVVLLAEVEVPTERHCWSRSAVQPAE
jgi:hypothetical protein